MKMEGLEMQGEQMRLEFESRSENEMCIRDRKKVAEEREKLAKYTQMMEQVNERLEQLHK